MSYDDRCLGWRKANVPFIVNGRVRSSLLTSADYEGSRSVWNTYRTARNHRRLPMPLGRSPGLQRNSLFTDRSTACPILQNESIEDVPPQLKLIVVLGLQYAALAKNEKGVNDEICSALRVVMLCLLEGWTRSNPGAALTVDADSKRKMKPTISILGIGYQELGIPSHWQKTVCILAFRVAGV